jgi:hypothetical protein
MMDLPQTRIRLARSVAARVRHRTRNHGRIAAEVARLVRSGCSPEFAIRNVFVRERLA